MVPAAVSALLIGVTDFFRDAPVFEALRSEILPELASRRRPLRVWSASCSNGAELYSMAILLAEAGLIEGSHLLGSDCRTDAVEAAQAALYTTHELRNIAPSNRERYFDNLNGRWSPVQQLRRCVNWKVADLGRHFEAGPWDVILWRNMAIYLMPEVAASVWQCLVSVLAPSGVLVTGQAERPPARLPLTCVKRCVYRLSDNGAARLPAPG